MHRSPLKRKAISGIVTDKSRTRQKLSRGVRKEWLIGVGRGSEDVAAIQHVSLSEAQSSEAFVSPSTDVQRGAALDEGQGVRAGSRLSGRDKSAVHKICVLLSAVLMAVTPGPR